MRILRILNREHINCNGWEAVAQQAAAVANNVASVSAGGKLDKRTRKFLRSERAIANEYNTSEREASQAWNEAMSDKANALTERWYNQYSSPQAMARQYLEAGLNPRMAAQTNNDTGPGQQASGSVGQQSSALGSFSPVSRQDLSMAGSFTDMSQAYKNIADAQKAGIETERLEKSMDAFLRMQNATADQQELFNKLNLQYAPMERRYKVIELLQDIENKRLRGKELKSVIENWGKKNKLAQNEIDTYYRSFEAYMSKLVSEANLNDSQRVGQDIQNRYLPRKLRAEIDNIISSTNLNNSIERLNGIDADQKEDLYDIVYYTAAYTCAGLDADLQQKYLDAYARALKNENLFVHGKEEVNTSMVGDIATSLRSNLGDLNDKILDSFGLDQETKASIRESVGAGIDNFIPEFGHNYKRPQSNWVSKRTYHTDNYVPRNNRR